MQNQSKSFNIFGGFFFVIVTWAFEFDSAESMKALVGINPMGMHDITIKYLS
jgi:hypothetical protein